MGRHMLFVLYLYWRGQPSGSPHNHHRGLKRQYVKNKYYTVNYLRLHFVGSICDNTAYYSYVWNMRVYHCTYPFMVYAFPEFLGSSICNHTTNTAHLLPFSSLVSMHHAKIQDTDF